MNDPNAQWQPPGQQPPPYRQQPPPHGQQWQYPPQPPRKKSRAGRWVLWSLAAFGLVVLLGIIAAPDKAASTGGLSSPTGAVQTTAPKVGAATEQALPPGWVSGDATLIVGVDIAPGTYRSAGARERMMTYCSWKRLSGFSGDASEMIAFGTAGANESFVLTVKPTDKGVEVSGCKPLQKIG